MAQVVGGSDYAICGYRIRVFRASTVWNEGVLKYVERIDVVLLLLTLQVRTTHAFDVH